MSGCELKTHFIRECLDSNFKALLRNSGWLSKTASVTLATPVSNTSSTFHSSCANTESHDVTDVMALAYLQATTIALSHFLQMHGIQPTAEWLGPQIKYKMCFNQAVACRAGREMPTHFWTNTCHEFGARCSG